MGVYILQHPVASHWLAMLRDEATKPKDFRAATHRVTTVLAIEATRSLPVTSVQVKTPLETMTSETLTSGIGVVAIMRAGNWMIEPITDLFPDVIIGHVGLERDETTAVASKYYSKLPDMNDRTVLLLDPMLATGGSASQAATMLRDTGYTDLKMLSIVAAPEGIERMQADHPNVDIWTAAVDRELNDTKFILPGLGDYGDRLAGT